MAQVDIALVEEDCLSGDQPTDPHQIPDIVQIVLLQELANIPLQNLDNTHDDTSQIDCLERHLQLLRFRDNHPFSDETDIGQSLLEINLPDHILSQGQAALASDTAVQMDIHILIPRTVGVRIKPDMIIVHLRQLTLVILDKRQATHILIRVQTLRERRVDVTVLTRNIRDIIKREIILSRHRDLIKRILGQTLFILGDRDSQFPAGFRACGHATQGQLMFLSIRTMLPRGCHLL